MIGPRGFDMKIRLAACLLPAITTACLGLSEESIGCRNDGDCETTGCCRDGACVALEVCAPPPEEPPSECQRDGKGPCPDGEVCTVDLEVPCFDGSPSCLRPTICERAAGGHDGPFACNGPSDCLSRICLDGGVCATLCDPGQERTGCPNGFDCRELELAPGALGHAGVGSEDPGLSLCRSDRDCPEAGDACVVLGGESLRSFGAVAVCATPGPGEPFEACGNVEGEHATKFSAACARGLCYPGCDDNDAPICGEQWCTSICEHDADCPAGLRCKRFAREADFFVEPEAPPFRVCQWEWGVTWQHGCRDDLDCCSSRNADGKWVNAAGELCCEEASNQQCGPDPETFEAHCGVPSAAPVDGTHVVTTCVLASEGPGPGAACASGADCAGGLCVDGRCTTACDPGSDRCAQRATPENPTSVCCPRELSIDGADVCVGVCATTCASPCTRG